MPNTTVKQDAATIRKALRFPAVQARVQLSKTQIFRLIKQGKFPPSHKLSDRVAAWDDAAISSWLEEKFAV